MKLNKKSKTPLVSLFLFFIFSCVHTPSRNLSPVLDLSGFVQGVSLKNPPIKFIKARAKIKIFNNEKNYRLKAGLLMSDDGSFFVETYGFGVPQGYLSLLDNQLIMIFPSRNEMYLGRGTSPLSKLMNVEISLDDLFDPMLRSIVIAQEQPLKMEILEKYYVVEDSNKNKFFINSSKWIEKIQLEDGCRVEYGESWSDKVFYPRNIALICKEQSIHIDFEEVEINEPIEKSSFQIDVPLEGFHVYSINDSVE